MDKKNIKTKQTNELRQLYENQNIRTQRQFKNNLEKAKKGLSRRFLNKDSYKEIGEIPFGNIVRYAILLGQNEILFDLNHQIIISKSNKKKLPKFIKQQ